MKSLNSLLRFAAGWLLCVLPAVAAPSLMENLGRGTVAVRSSATDVFVGWRYLGTDASDVAFNLYRATGGGAPVKLNAEPLTGATNYVDTTADLTQSNVYSVAAVVGGVEQAATGAFTVPANAAIQQYLSVPMQVPAGGVTSVGEAYNYTANDCSVGDLDGDGEYEILVKWEPTNAKDNSQSGHTGNVLFDAYKLDGTRLWRIDLGVNIRAGAHYTQFLVYDFDGDGRAELVCKTAPGTKDSSGGFIAQPGKFIGTPSAPINHAADYRNGGGYILTGPEFFTVFDGLSGAELATTNYVVPRNNDPASANVTGWGDDYGNRVDRFLACVAYLDGQRPSIVLCRGYYTRAVLAAWDWRDGQLTPRWVFDTGNSGTPSPLANWRGQGAHSLTVGDVDGDGRDEITYGAAGIDDDGTGLYSTLLGHGDALHMSDMDPARPGLEVWMVHEDPGSYGPNGADFRDAKTGAVIFGVNGQNSDVGRGAAGDIDPRYLGYEMWGARGSLMAANGTAITGSKPAMNFMAYWDGDLLRETLDGTTIAKWNWLTSSSSPVLQPSGISSNNSTKANPCLSADMLGDWREEVIWRTSDSSALRIYTTTAPTTHRIFTLMHDRMYRLAIAWQNVAYNQPPHPGFYLGEGMSTPPQPEIVTSLAALGTPTPAVTTINRYDPFTTSTGATSVTFRVYFNTPVTGVNASDFILATTGGVTGTVSTVTPLSAVAYNVTVGSILGTGTLRLDLAASGTGITGPGGVPISGGFTAGQTYSRATLAWIKQTTGGLWSDVANWDGGVIADGTGAIPIFGNFDLTASNTVVLDGPRTVGGITFGDTDTSTAASWLIDDNGNPENNLTLDASSGSATITVNALGAGATATLATGLEGGDGLTKAGAGTLVLTKPNTLTGSVNVNGGILRVGPGSTLTSTSSAGIANSGSILNVAGGSFTSGGLVTVNAPTSFVVDSGTVALNAGIRTNNADSATIRVNGGTVTVSDITIQRAGGAAPNFAAGVIITGGNTTAGTVSLGTNNSSGALSVEGGSFTANGTITVGWQASGGRGGGVRVTNGTFTSNDAVNGLVLSRRHSGGNTNQVVSAAFSGGLSTVEKLTFGFDANVNAGSGTVTVNGGALYLGAGGIVKNATAGMATTVNLTSGILGAKSNWATSHPLTLTAGSTIAIKAADAADNARTITLNGAVGGSGGLTKTGAGTLVLAATNPFTGDAAINAGTLAVTGSLAAGGNVLVNNGGTLAGTGTVNKSISLLSGGSISPGTTGAGTLNGASLTWNGGGKLAFDLGASADKLVLGGALTKGSSGAYEFVFNLAGPLTIGASYPLATFGSTTFTAGDFTYSGLSGAGEFTVNGTSLTFTITSDGSGLASYNAWIAPFNLPAGQNGPSADPDGDGLSNLLESVLALNPGAAGVDGIVVTKVTVSGVEYPAIQFVRRQGLGDVKIEVRVASTLDFTNTLGSVEFSSAPSGNGTDLVVIRSSVPLSQQPEQFFRLFAKFP
jgi:autotransporter-associated beta strand protein